MPSALCDGDEIIACRQRRRQALGGIEHEIEPDQVIEPEDAGLGNAHGPSDDGVGLLDRQAVVQRLDHRDLQRIATDAVGQKTRCIAAGYDALAEAQVAELTQARGHLGPGLRAGHQLQEAHVAHRVEEMRDTEISHEPHRHALGQQSQRDR
jgi:hypothetical protein